MIYHYLLSHQLLIILPAQELSISETTTLDNRTQYHLIQKWKIMIFVEKKEMKENWFSRKINNKNLSWKYIVKENVMF